nr:3'-5' exonuclease [uncultured Methanolobus sp.]
MTDNLSPSQRARNILSKNPVFLDTETTGLGNTDQICEISIIDSFGKVLLNTLVKPTILMKKDAEAIHGISDEMLKDAPKFIDIIFDLVDVLHGRHLVIYNADYDMRMLKQSLKPYEFAKLSDIGIADIHCAMLLYAEYWGEWDDYRQSYKWQRLGNAMLQQGINFNGTLHRALADTEITRQLVYKMAQMA